jgi:trk system potassium uptake protein TrkH
MGRNRVVIKYLGYILLFNALFLFIAALISLFQRESSLNALLFSAAMCATLGTFPYLFIEKVEELRFHEGLAISVLGWLLTCIVHAHQCLF